MARPRKMNKLAQTTIAVNIELVEQFEKLKRKRESMNDFLIRLFNDYNDTIDANNVLKDLYYKKNKELESIKKVNNIVIPELTIETQK